MFSLGCVPHPPGQVRRFFCWFCQWVSSCLLHGASLDMISYSFLFFRSTSRSACARTYTLARAHRACMYIHVVVFLTTVTLTRTRAHCVLGRSFHLFLLRYDPVCVRAGNPEIYCGAAFSEDRFRDDFRAVRSHASGATVGTVDSDETTLSAACTPCTYAFTRIINRFATTVEDLTNVDRVIGIDDVCARDGNKFCFPRYMIPPVSQFHTHHYWHRVLLPPVMC